MNGFLGEFEATLDAKGRFLLPAGFKKQLSESDAYRFVINRGFEKCLSFYPISTWLPLEDKINALNDFDPKVRQFKRMFLNGATLVEPDSAGRILLPASLKEYAHLEKNIVMVPAGNKMEIWDQDEYKKFFDSFTPESFSDLANEVMGFLK
ncbi:MAG: division/cell wall cluster transcriptional repressor MraZ [Chitinophagaceae bacterium]|nr:MAG: division/cell wall cluster transcriptional repressor MraZ [Chitinophagaceae bacterium]